MTEAFLEWARRIPEPKTGSLDFARFPYLRELYADGVDVEQIALMKSTQVGASAWLVRWAIYWADVHGKTALYVVPGDEQLRSFYNARIATLLRGPYFSGRVANAAVSNVHQREIGNGWLNLRGAQTVAGLETTDADVLAIDEYDLIPREAVPVAERRLSAPTSLGLIRRIGWPTIDGFGIAKQYAQSDRRRWFVKCPSCREQQFLRFFHRRASSNEEAGDDLPNATSAYVDVTEAVLRCGRCDTPLEPETIARGEWVAEFPSRDLRGYHVHRLLAPGARLRPLIEASQALDPWEKQSFHNRDLGEPYSEKQGRLSKAAIAAAQSAGGNYLQGPWDEGYNGDGLVTMGVDTATERDLNVRISLYEGPDLRQKRALLIGTVEDFNTLVRLMDIYNVRMACIDHLPDGRLARSFTDMFYGRAYSAYFLPPSAKDEMTFDAEERKAGLKRTEAIDATLGLIRATRNRLPIDLPAGYVEQLRNAVRFHELDELGRRTVGYKAHGPIDYLMAEVYDLFARELFKADWIYQELSQETYTTLDQHLDFERSNLGDYDSIPEYDPGPPEPDFPPFFDGDDWGYY